MDRLALHRRRESVTLRREDEDLRSFVISLPELLHMGEGRVIHRGRNELRLLEYVGEEYVVKAFGRADIVNRFVYASLRGSKARRSFEHAIALDEIGVPTPEPVAYMDVRKGLTLRESYYVCRKSHCPHRYEDLFYQEFSYAEEVLREIGRVTARMHNNGIMHLDYGRGNILFGRGGDGGIELDIVDLNRMRKGRVDMKAGCKNLDRLPATPEMHRWLAEEYALARGFSADRCFALMQAYRSTQPGKIDGRY